MTTYSFNQSRQGVVFAKLNNVNASFKDLCAVCDAVRFKSTEEAMRILDAAAAREIPIKFRRNNKGMGTRRALGGVKGRWPGKCAAIVRKTLKNALATAKTKGLSPESTYVVHASANKTLTARRTPSKGLLVFGAGRYGRGSTRFSDLEFAKVELGIASDYDKLSAHTKRALKATRALESKAKPKSGAKEQAKPKAEKAKAPKPEKAAKPAGAEAKPVEAPPVAAQNGA